MCPSPSSKPSADQDPARGMPGPILVNAAAAAAALSISERAFHSLRKRPDFPRDATVVIGPRCVRFRLEALHVFARSLVSMPRSEPKQLRRSRNTRPKRE
jgi:hypothetical protein